MDLQEFLTVLHQNQVEFIDFRFTDLRGIWHHITFPLSAVDKDLLNDGICFDGSSIAGWRPINNSDMVLKPCIPSSQKEIVFDPFYSDKTVILNCNVLDPLSNDLYNRDPRSLALRAESFLANCGFADRAFFGPEAEFFIFDNVRYQSGYNSSFYEVESDEFPHNNAGVDSPNFNHGHRPQHKGGYFPVMPLDSIHDIRAQMMHKLEQMGVPAEKHHHEVAPAQHELGIKYNTLVNSADQLQVYKYVVRNVARSYGKTATFMAKPIYGDNGSGMHVHQSLWFNGQTLFAGQEYAGLSKTALHYIGGILKHAKSINAFTNPTTNSYKRLIPGFEAPVILAYSAHNRSASCRIPLSNAAPARRIEIRFPDPTANPYLAFSAMLMAGIDGIINEIDPGIPQDADLFEDKKLAASLPSVSGSLREALVSLESDHEYLLRGDVFNKDMIEAYSELKWQEVHAFEHRPHPIEFNYAFSL